MERSSHSLVGTWESRRSVRASPVETTWTTGARSLLRSSSIDAIRVGHFIAVSRCEKKRCLASSKAERAAALARALQTSPVSMPVASRAAPRLWWMILKALAYSS